MTQAEAIAAALLAGFVIYLAMNRRLILYWRLLSGGAAAKGST